MDVPPLIPKVCKSDGKELMGHGNVIVYILSPCDVQRLAHHSLTCKKKIYIEHNIMVIRLTANN